MTRTFVLAALLMGCGDKTAQPTAPSTPAGTLSAVSPEADNPIGTIGGAPVDESALLRLASTSRPADGKTHSPEERAKLIDDLITEEVLFQKALERGLYHDPKVKKILTNLLLRKEVYGNVTTADFGEEELRAYYDAHKEEFVVSDKVQAKRITLTIGSDRAATEAKIKELHSQVKANPASFGKIAVEHSDGPYKRRGGDLNFVPREGKPGVEAEVIARAFEMKVDEISEPFEVGGAFHILLVLNKRDRVERSFDQMKGSVLRMVKQEKFEALRGEFIANARAETTIVMDEKKLETLDLSRRSPFGPGPTNRPSAGHNADDGHGHGKDAGHGKDDGHGH